MNPGRVTLLFLLSAIGLSHLHAQDMLGEKQDTTVRKGAELSLYTEQNEQNCLVCHGKMVYTLTDTVSGVSRKQLMSEQNVVSPDLFYNSVHWSFNCLDCHSEGFKSF